MQGQWCWSRSWDSGSNRGPRTGGMSASGGRRKLSCGGERANSRNLRQGVWSRWPRCNRAGAAVGRRALPRFTRPVPNIDVLYASSPALRHASMWPLRRLCPPFLRASSGRWIQDSFTEARTAAACALETAPHTPFHAAAVDITTCPRRRRPLPGTSVITTPPPFITTPAPVPPPARLI